MKVKIEEYYGDGWSTIDELSIHAEGNGVKNSLHFANRESEDNNMSRNFIDARRIAALIVQAYEAGKAGEDFRLSYELTRIEESDSENTCKKNTSKPVEDGSYTVNTDDMPPLHRFK